MPPDERLRTLAASISWSVRDVAAKLGEHYTSARMWSIPGHSAPDRVLVWLDLVTQPIRRHPNPAALADDSDYPVEPSRWPVMQAAELGRMRALLRWTRTELAASLGVTVEGAKSLLSGTRDLSPLQSEWLRAVTFNLRLAPLPEDWKPAVEYLPPAEPWGRPISGRLLADNPRRQERERKAALRREEEAEVERLSQERAARRRRAYDMRVEQGASFPTIGKALGISHQAAQALIKREQRIRDGKESA